WSPPGMWKDNNSATNGGSLLPEHYQDWANQLAEFAVNMQSQGVPLLMLSAQNEPNWTASWETCIWDPQALLTFMRDYLARALASRGLALPLMTPETINWNSVQNFAEPLVLDTTMKSALGVIATHAYGGNPFYYTAPSNNGLEYWETEVSDPTS